MMNSGYWSIMFLHSLGEKLGRNSLTILLFFSCFDKVKEGNTFEDSIALSSSKSTVASHKAERSKKRSRVKYFGSSMMMDAL